MKKFLIIVSMVVLTSGCATNPEVEKSISRDRTAESMAKAAIIGEMLKSDDPLVRARGAEAAAEFVKKEKKFFIGW